MSKQLYIIYDERAILEGTDEASVCCTASSLNEARRDCRDMCPRGVIYRYDVTAADELVNEMYIEGPEHAPYRRGKRR